MLQTPWKGHGSHWSRRARGGRGKRGGSVGFLELLLGLCGSEGDYRLRVRVCRRLERLLLWCHQFGGVWVFWCRSWAPAFTAQSWYLGVRWLHLFGQGGEHARCCRQCWLVLLVTMHRVLCFL